MDYSCSIKDIKLALEWSLVVIKAVKRKCIYMKVKEYVGSGLN